MYCKTELGKLEKTNNKTYVYNSNVLNEQELLNTNEGFKASNYSLWNSSDMESTYLFGEFSQLIYYLSKKELIIKSAKITEKDSEWEKLVKFAKLNYSTRGFYVQVADIEKKVRKTP